MVYDKTLSDPVVMGSVEDIKPTLLALVKKKVEERNMALVGRDYDIAEQRIER